MHENLKSSVDDKDIKKKTKIHENNKNWKKKELSNWNKNGKKKNNKRKKVTSLTT